MAARIDPFVDVLLREQGDQLYLLPDEPVTMVKDGKPRKVSRQPLTDQHIYALLVEVAPSESADHIDQMTETEFEYIADRGMVRVRIVPDGGRLTAMVARVENSTATQSPATGPAPAAQRAPAGAGATAPAAPPPRPPKPSAIAAAPLGPSTSPRRSTKGPNAPWASCSRRWCSRRHRTCTCAWASRPCSGLTAR